MSTRKRTQIPIQTDRVLIVRRGNFGRAWCKRCSSEVDMVTLDTAGVLAQVEQETIQGWLEAEELHLSQAPDGSARMCLNSLLRSVRQWLL